MYNEPGNILNPEKFEQKVSFKGLKRDRGISPTDIDACIDYNGNAFVYMEFKTEGAELKNGQRMALENIVKSHSKAGHPSCALILYHNTPARNEIIAKDLIVDNVYQNNKWRDWRSADQTLLQFLEYWEKWCKSENVKI
jgi:hypothetical protein